MSFDHVSRYLRLGVPLLLALAVAACSRQEEPGADGAAPATAAAKPAAAVSAEVQAMDADTLRESATKALRENRIYAPGGDNAMEYYLALRDKLPNDPGVASALTDLLPYTLIAAEQSIAREEFAEAQRLSAIIEKADPKAPALPRLKQSIVSTEQAAAKREQDQTRNKTEEDARQKEQQRLAQLAEQQRATEAAAAQQLAQQQEAERQESARQEAARQQEAERQAAAQREAAANAARAAAVPAATAPVAQSLRAVSTPAPRYPPEALRSGTSGEVLVEITVGTDGSVTNARVVRATPARVFDREALNAVRRWRFEPVDAPVTTRRTIAFAPG